MCYGVVVCYRCWIVVRAGFVCCIIVADVVRICCALFWLFVRCVLFAVRCRCVWLIVKAMLFVTVVFFWRGVLLMLLLV